MCVETPHGFIFFSFVGIRPYVKRHRQIVNNNKKFTYRLNGETFTSGTKRWDDSTERFSIKPFGIVRHTVFFSSPHKRIRIGTKRRGIGYVCDKVLLCQLGVWCDEIGPSGSAIDDTF